MADTSPRSEEEAGCKPSGKDPEPGYIRRRKEYYPKTMVVHDERFYGRQCFRAVHTDPSEPGQPGKTVREECIGVPPGGKIGLLEWFGKKIGEDMRERYERETGGDDMRWGFTGVDPRNPKTQARVLCSVAIEAIANLDIAIRLLQDPAKEFITMKEVDEAKHEPIFADGCRERIAAAVTTLENLKKQDSITVPEVYTAMASIMTAQMSAAKMYFS